MNDQTRESVRQWLEKAKSDWTAVEILTGSDECPADTVCFHCQQYVEKLLKAVLTCYSIEAPKTHDLRRLVQLAEPFVPGLASSADAADELTFYGVETRYPGDWQPIQKAEMEHAVELAEGFAALLMPKLEEWTDQP